MPVHARRSLLTILALSFAAASRAQPLATPDAGGERDLAALAGAARAGVAADLRLPGSATAAFEGLQAGEALTSHLMVVNRADAANRCALLVASADGTRVAPLVSFTLGAGEERPILDALAPLGVAGVVPGRAELSCAGDFYAVGMVSDAARDSQELVAAQQLDKAIVLPAAAPCPENGVCFDAPGVDHVPQPPPGKAVGRVVFPAPAGAATRLVLSLDVTVADWYAPHPSGKHLIFWFVISKNVDMPGMLYFLGPGKNQAFVRHGIGLKHPDKIKAIKPFKALVGHTYHIVNDYDMAAHKYTVTITDQATGEVLTVSSVPNVGSYTFKSGQKLIVDMGFPAVAGNPTEVPSYGWTYRDLHVEMHRP